jgi:hypothetical protein
MTGTMRWIVAAMFAVAATSGSASAETPPPSAASGADVNSSTGRPGAYSGGYFDDGFVDDDWFYDYYEIQSHQDSSRPEAGGRQTPSRQKEYQAEQLYEDVRTSGLFDF